MSSYYNTLTNYNLTGTGGLDKWLILTPSESGEFSRQNQ